MGEPHPASDILMEVICYLGQETSLDELRACVATWSHDHRRLSNRTAARLITDIALRVGQVERGAWDEHELRDSLHQLRLTAVYDPTEELTWTVRGARASHGYPEPSSQGGTSMSGSVVRGAIMFVGDRLASPARQTSMLERARAGSART